MVRVADYIASFIYKELNIDTIFMVSGGGIMHLTDAVACHPKLKYICSYNEQATTMEADGYAKARRSFGVALLTTGPGATNGVTGVVGAWQDSSPVFVISGQSNSRQTIYNSGLKTLRQFGVQEVNIIPIIESVTKYAQMVNDPQKIKYHLQKAKFLAKYHRPGPVWIDVPLDVQGALIDPRKLESFDPIKEGYQIHRKNNKKEIEKVYKLLIKAKRPIILAGQGISISKAEEKLNVVSKYLNIPIVISRLGIDIMPTNCSRYIGRVGIKGDRAGNFAVQNADLIIVIGSRLSVNVTGHEYQKFAREGKVIVIDIDEIEHQKNTVKIDSFIKMDAKEFLENIIELFEEKVVDKNKVWIKKCQEWKSKYPVVLPEYQQQKNLVNTYYFTDVLSNNLNKGDIIVIDSGSSSYVVSQAIKIKEKQKYLASGGLGAMGYSIPAGIGAACGQKNRVICITGDGSLQMNVQELQILSYLGLNVKIFIFNNKGYSSIKNTQDRFFQGRYIGVDKQSGVCLPDTLKIAKLYGIKGICINKSDEVEKKVKEALSDNKPIICDIICSSDQLIIPTVYSIKKSNGQMVSKPLEDMYPFLPRDEFKKNMIIPILPE